VMAIMDLGAGLVSNSPLMSNPRACLERKFAPVSLVLARQAV